MRNLWRHYKWAATEAADGEGFRSFMGFVILVLAPIVVGVMVAVWLGMWISFNMPILWLGVIPVVLVAALLYVKPLFDSYPHSKKYNADSKYDPGTYPREF